MDSAVYEASTQKIFGVRGQWLFQFNSVTGALENSLRFMTTVNGFSSITTFGGGLYIGVSWQPTINWQNVIYAPDVDIYKVDAASFTVVGRLNLGGKNTFGTTTEFAGFRYLTNNGAALFGTVQDGQLFNVDPTNVPGYTSTNVQTISDCAYDSHNNVLWVPVPKFPNIYCYDTTFGSTCFDTNGNLNTICGICYNSAQNKVYAVDGTFAFYSFSAALAVPGFTNFAVNSFNSGRINSTAFRIKSVNNLPSNPRNGKILMPTWADDSVLVIDPLTDTVTNVLTGFTSPWDIVSTPSKNWAIQTGATALKEIT